MNRLSCPSSTLKPATISTLQNMIMQCLALNGMVSGITTITCFLVCYQLIVGQPGYEVAMFLCFYFSRTSATVPLSLKLFSMLPWDYFRVFSQIHFVTTDWCSLNSFQLLCFRIRWGSGVDIYLIIQWHSFQNYWSEAFESPDFQLRFNVMVKHRRIVMQGLLLYYRTEWRAMKVQHFTKRPNHKPREFSIFAKSNIKSNTGNSKRIYVQSL